LKIFKILLYICNLFTPIISIICLWQFEFRAPFIPYYIMNILLPIIGFWGRFVIPIIFGMLIINIFAILLAFVKREVYSVLLSLGIINLFFGAIFFLHVCAMRGSV